MPDSYDALVIGGGPAGATTAALLAQAGWAVLVVERKVFPRRKVCGEYLSATNLPLLRRLGLAEAFCARAGPAVTEVGLFAGRTILHATLPQPPGERRTWGQALGREHLDTMLLAQAIRQGASVRQPCSAVALEPTADGYCCRLRDPTTEQYEKVTAAVVIAAHGSWEVGTLPTQVERPTPGPGDLLGFKAHFTGSALPPGLMPLLAFPGGYGGMVHCDGGRLSLSLCVRRDCLARLRQEDASTAGEVVLAYLKDCCAGVRQALAGAERQDNWLATGPIRPGIRCSRQPGLFLVGNAAGEAHPVVAEGISMAMQAGWLLARRLIEWRRQGRDRSRLAAVAEDYSAVWRRSFGPRLRASMLLAHWAMRPATVTASLPLLHCFPHILSWGARLSGKATRVV
jgi:2-polyprenyl-6-methoxyphenol hydroxylase-like FAD-dependent oxidoreductase